jgi:hypothetical protein
LEGGDHVGVTSETEFPIVLGLERNEPRCEDHGTDVDFLQLLSLIVDDRIRSTGIFASQTLSTYPTLETSVRLLASLMFGEAEDHFAKTCNAFLHGKQGWLLALLRCYFSG